MMLRWRLSLLNKVNLGLARKEEDEGLLWKSRDGLRMGWIAGRSDTGCKCGGILFYWSI